LSPFPRPRAAVSRAWFSLGPLSALDSCKSPRLSDRSCQGSKIAKRRRRRPWQVLADADNCAAGAIIRTFPTHGTPRLSRPGWSRQHGRARSPAHRKAGHPPGREPRTSPRPRDSRLSRQPTGYRPTRSGSASGSGVRALSRRRVRPGLRAALKTYRKFEQASRWQLRRSGSGFANLSEPVEVGNSVWLCAVTLGDESP
jgi:hypothetical protein